MGESFYRIELHFTKYCDAFYDVLLSVLRYIAVRFTKQ